MDNESQGTVDWSQFTPIPAPTADAPAAPAVDWSQFTPAPAPTNDLTMADAGASDFGAPMAETPTAGKVADVAGDVGDAAKVAGISGLAGMAKLPYQATKVGTLAAGVLPMAYDSITGAFRQHGNDHAATDAWFANAVEPNDAQMAKLDDAVADQAAINAPVAHGAQMVGDVASNLSAAVLTGGGAAIPDALTMGGKMFADLSTKELLTGTVANALGHSTAASAPQVLTHGEDTAERVYDETGSMPDAIKAAAGTAAATVLTNALPAGINGGLATRMAAGAVAGGAGAEANRQIENSAMPTNMQTPFSWHDTGWGMLMGTSMGLAFHSQVHEDPQVVATRYNDIQKEADAGNPDAQRAASIVSQLTTVDGLNAAAIDAAEAGVTAHAAVTDAPHPQLMEQSDRYRQIYQSAQDLPLDQRAAYAKATYANEQATNTSWDTYLGNRNDQTKADTKGMVYQQIKDLMTQADQVVPPVEMQKVNRWAFMESRTPLEVRKALSDTVNEKAAPDYVQDKYGEDFHDDGFLTQTAFERDAADHPDKQPVAFDDTPEVNAAMDQARVNPYRLDNGRLAVLGDPDALASIITHIHTTTGAEPHFGDIAHENAEAGLHTEQRSQDAGTDEGSQEGNAATEGRDAEGGQPAQADQLDEAEAVGEAPEVSARAKPVVDALADVGDGVRVGSRGEVRIDQDAAPEVVEKAMDVAAKDTAADTTAYDEPTPAQANAGNYRKGGVLFKSDKGDVRVRIENPDGSIRKGEGWSRPIKGAHYGYIPDTRSADGQPLDVFLTRHAHDANRPVAVISQHDPVTGKFDELKVVMGAKDRAEAMALYAKQYPLGMTDKLLPKGKGNVVMMDRAKFNKFLKSKAVDVPPHPISGEPMLSLRDDRNTRPPKPEPKPAVVREGKSIEQRVAEAKAARVEAKPEPAKIPERITPNTVEGRAEKATGIDAKTGKVVDEAAFSKAVEKYNTLDDTDGGKTLSADVARELSDDYMKNRSLSAEVHEPASGFTKALYARKLAEPGESNMVAFTAGGTGAGKTSSLRDNPSIKQADIIYDTNMNTFSSAKKKIDQALAAGKDVSVYYVYRDPVEAMVNGALKRAKRQEAEFGTGRTVPVGAHVDTHVGAYDTMLKLRAHYADDPRFDIHVIESTKTGPKEVSLDDIQQLHYHEVNKAVREALDTEYANGNISKEIYHGFTKDNPGEEASRLEILAQTGERDTGEEAGVPRGVHEGGDEEPQGRGGRQGPADEVARTPAQAAKHAVDIAEHARKVTAGWKSAPHVEVMATRADLPEDTRHYLDAVIGKGTEAAGLYRHGRVYLFADQIADKAHAERTVLHETVGHVGLRGVFGKDLNPLLDEIHADIKDVPAFSRMKELYRSAYAGRGHVAFERAVTEEYLADIAASGKDQSTWARFVGWFRQWARSKGMVSRWTENDLKTLLGKVADDMREGRVSLAGLEPPQATFDEEAGTVASTYRGAAGEGTVTQPYDGSSRTLKVGEFEATFRGSTLNGENALSVDHLTLPTPTDLLRLTRYAAEEGAGVVAIGKDTLPRADLEASGIPFTERPGHWELPASQGIESQPMFSLRNQASAGPEVAEILKRAVAHPDSNLTAWDRMQTAMRDVRDDIQNGDSAMAMKQAYVDALAPIERYERATNGGLLLDAAHSAYKSAWMAKNNEQITAGVMKLGVPEYKDGSFVPVAGRTGLMDIFKPLFHTPDGKGLDMLWEGYAMAKRSNELIKQTNPDGTSREKLLSQDDIDKLLSLEKAHPVLKQVFDDYQKFNHQLLDLAVDRGTMSKDTADLWKDNMYVPFYRALEENKNDANTWRQGKGISGKKVSSMRLYGSAKMVEPVIENIIKNTGSILDKVYSNEAMRRVVALTDGIGMERQKIPMKGVEVSLGEIEKALGRIGYQMGVSKNGKYTGTKYGHFVPQDDMDKLVAFFKQAKPQGPDIVTVYENGKAMYYKVTDAHLYRAVTAFNDIGKFDQVLGAVLGIPKKVLTLGVTLDLRFMYRNLFRDAVTAYIQTGTNPNLIKGVIKNSAEVWKDGAFLNALRVAGYNGNEYFKVNEMREHLRDMHGTKWTVLNTPRELYHAYHKIGFVSEQLNRMRVARHTLEQGGSMAEAAWQAQNTLNFQKRGDSRAMQLLIRGTPFLNARIQGLNRLYEGATGRDVTNNRKRAVLSFLLKSTGLFMAGMALSEYNKNDPRYQRLPEAAKDLYYHFFIGDHHFVLPKPFELGSILTTVPERVMRLAEGKDNTRTFVESMGRIAQSIFSFDPTPQVVKPLLDDYANKDSLSGAPIVNQQLSGLEAGAQYNPNTSPTIKAVAHAMPTMAPDILRSPVRLEHMYRGYTAQMGMYLMMMSDAAVRATGNAPATPTSRYGNKIVGAIEGTFGYGNPDTDPRNKYMQQLFDAQDNADKAANTVRAYLKQGHLDDARETMNDNRTALAYQNAIHSVAKDMAGLRQIEMQVLASPTMTGDEKREKIDRINAVRREKLETVAPILEIAADYQH